MQDSNRRALGPILLRVVNQMDLSPCDGCDQCGLRCTAGVQMTREEYSRSRTYTAANRECVESVETQDKAVDLGDGVTVQACRFRDNERGCCAIYPARPLVCRLLGHVEWMPCPIEKVKRIVPTEEALSLMAAYSSVERRTYEEWQADGEN